MRKILTLHTPARWRSAVRSLREADKRFDRLIERTGPVKFRPKLDSSPFASLLEAIVSQQVSTAAATTIHGRVLKQINVRGAPSPRKLLKLPDQALREAGLSRQKVSYVQDLARHVLDGELSTLEELMTLPDEDIIRQFTAIRGVGKWTVEMYLIFNLGRPDVWPVDDLVIRKAATRLLRLKEVPTARALQPMGEKWAPYRSVASIYLWKMLD